MAARIRKIRHDAETRARIKTSQIVNRLEGHIFGKVKLEASQVTAALGLLKKTVPDLSATEISGDVNVTNYDVSSEPASADEWAAQHTTQH